MKDADATETRLLELVEAFRELSPRQRSRLVRRLRVMGLWDPEEFVSDRDRLRIAPALNSATFLRPITPTVADSAAKQAQETADSESMSVQAPEASYVRPRSASTSSPVERPADSSAGKRVEPPDTGEPQTYHSAVSSRFVVTADAESDNETRSTMSPLPGQASEEPIGIIFDGGTRGDPALGYGSYAIRWPGLPQQVVRLRFGSAVTGAEAEYDTLIAALEATLKRLQDNGAAPDTARLDIRGDSQVVLSQVRGDAEIAEPSLRMRCDRVRFLLRRFSSWRLSRYHRSSQTGSTSDASPA